jgi:hypothetical protein
MASEGVNIGIKIVIEKIIIQEKNRCNNNNFYIVQIHEVHLAHVYSANDPISVTNISISLNSFESFD